METPPKNPFNSEKWKKPQEEEGSLSQDGKACIRLSQYVFYWELLKISFNIPVYSDERQSITSCEGNKHLEVTTKVSHFPH